MSGIKVYTANINAVRLAKGMTVAEFKSWIVGTFGGLNNESYQSVIQTSDGGYVAVGYQNTQGQGSNDALIVKYDSNLNVVTQKSLGGSGGDAYISVIESSDGGYVAIGNQSSQSQGYSDLFVVKYDSSLNVVTQKGLGGSSYDYYQSVIQSNDGGYVAVGYQQSQGQGSYDALIVKYDSSLNVVTQKGLGGSGSDQYYSVIQSNDGGYVAVGYQSSQSQGSSDALIVKYDSNLNVVAQKCLGASMGDVFNSVIQTSDGGYVAAGYQNSQGQGGTDALIVKYDSNLNVVSQKIIGGSGSERYQSVIQTNDGGYVAVGDQWSQGQGGSEAFVVKYDSNFNVVSQKSLGGSGSDYYRSVIQSSDGGYVAVGYQDSQSQGGTDALITKLPNDFTLLSGSLQNHSGLAWTDLTLVEATSTLVETAPTLTEYSNTLIAYFTTLTETTTTLTEIRSVKQ